MYYDTKRNFYFIVIEEGELGYMQKYNEILGPAAKQRD